MAKNMAIYGTGRLSFDESRPVSLGEAAGESAKCVASPPTPPREDVVNL